MLIIVMILYFKGCPSRHYHANAFRVFVNSFLYISSLTSLCFGQIFAISPGYPSISSRESSGDNLGFNANFPVDKTSADIVLGALFPMHNKNITEHGPTCGSLNVERGIHRFQAAVFAVEEINKSPHLLPNITLGLSAYDTCGRDTRALEESLQFVMESLAKNRTVSCPSTFSSSSRKERIMAGVVGAAASTVSIQIANLLRLFKLPQISYASTSTDLSDKAKYDFFVRTVPPDNYQARAMIDVVRGLKWTSVFAVSSEGNYGERGIREFTNGAKAANICIAGTFKIDGGSSGDKQIGNMVSEFLKRQNVRGIILFCTDTDARRILQEAKRRNAAGKFTWIASDYWGTRKKTIEGLEKYAEGAITISLTETSFDSFKQYLTSLKPDNHSLRVNPWFKEFWETQFNCRLDESGCRSRSLRDMDMRIDDKVPFVIDAVYAFAYGLDVIYKSLCPARNGLCPELMRHFDGKRLRDILFNVSFTGVTGPVSFDRNGNGPGRYDIFRLQGGKYVKIASWDDKLYDAKKLYDGGKNATTTSRCGVPCLAGYYKVFDFDGSCCWNCKKCPENNYVEDEISCKPCRLGERPNAKFSGCESLPRRYIARSWSIMVMVFAGLGIMCTIFVGILFYINNDTPLVKASGRELTCALLLGLLSCYVFSFFLLAEPSTVVCAIQRFGLGFSFCVCYAAILIRSSRIARIFEKSKRSTKPPMLINPASQIAILGVFICVDVAFAVLGLAKWPPENLLAYPTNKDVLLICNIQSYDLIFALTYNAIIIVFCTFYAFRTRKTPANFNEARYIGFAMYTTCIIWLAFIPVQIGVNKDYATITLSINTTLNATTLLLCIFGPKVYILVLRPTRNLRSKSLNSWRPQETEFQQTTGREKSESQTTDISVKSNTSAELGVENLAMENGHVHFKPTVKENIYT